MRVSYCNFTIMYYTDDRNTSARYTDINPRAHTGYYKHPALFSY